MLSLTEAHSAGRCLSRAEEECKPGEQCGIPWREIPSFVIFVRHWSEGWKSALPWDLAGGVCIASSVTMFSWVGCNVLGTCWYLGHKKYLSQSSLWELLTRGCFCWYKAAIALKNPRIALEGCFFSKSTACPSLGILCPRWIGDLRLVPTCLC